MRHETPEEAWRRGEIRGQATVDIANWIARPDVLNGLMTLILLPYIIGFFILKWVFKKNKTIGFLLVSIIVGFLIYKNIDFNHKGDSFSRILETGL